MYYHIFRVRWSQTPFAIKNLSTKCTNPLIEDKIDKKKKIKKHYLTRLFETDNISSVR